MEHGYNTLSFLYNISICVCGRYAFSFVCQVRYCSGPTRIAFGRKLRHWNKEKVRCCIILFHFIPLSVSMPSNSKNIIRGHTYEYIYILLWDLSIWFHWIIFFPCLLLLLVSSFFSSSFFLSFFPLPLPLFHMRYVIIINICCVGVACVPADPISCIII